MALASLLGESIVRSEGDSVPVSDISKGVVGLYFSAHWCPPCRGFTPKLADFYTNFKDKHKEQDFEIVFVSSDRTQEDFDSYFKEMPFLGLPFDDRDRKGKLNKRYKVQGIPSFILIDGSTGDLISSKARNDVIKDPEGSMFPWRPSSVADTMKMKVLRGDTLVDLESEREGKYLGLYFSAHWCPPCRTFTPKLVDTYNKMKTADKKLEILFVSADRSEEAFKEYFDTMPWLAVPYGDSNLQQLPELFEVNGIPSLTILDENLKVLTTDGRAYADRDPEGKEFPWKSKPLEPLDDMSASKLNDSVCMIYFTGGDESLSVQAAALMEGPANSYYAAREADESLPELAFLYETSESEEMADSVQGFAKLPEGVQSLVFLDIPEQKKYVHNGDITAEVINSLISEFKDESLSWVSMSEK